MSDYFNCKVCDKPIKMKSKKNHLNSINHKSLSTSVVNRYSVTNPDFLQIENILKNYVLDYTKKFAFYLNICKCKIHFSDTIVSAKSDTWMSKFEDFLKEISYYQKLNISRDRDIIFFICRK